MKSVLLALTAFVAAAAAQNSLGNDCLGRCYSSMQSPEKAEELGCSGGDYKCICKQGTVEKFMAGFRDCAAQACPGADSKSLIDVATNLCRGTGVVVTDKPGASSSGSSSSGQPSSTASAPNSSSSADGNDDDGDNSSSGGAGGAGDATTSSPGASPTGSESASSTGSNNPAESTGNSGASSSGNGGSGGASQTRSGGASSSSSAGFAAPQMTTAPVSGLFATVGVAALLI